MATFNVQLNSKSNKDGLYSIFIRVTENRKHRRLLLDFRVPAEHFNPVAKYGKWIRTSNPDHAIHNNKIETAIANLKIKYNQLAEVNQNPLDSIKKPAEEIFNVTIGKYSDDFLAAMDADSAVGYYRHVKSKVKRFVDYIGRETPIDQVTTAHVKEYKMKLLGESLAGSTINDNFKRVHALFKAALRDELIEKDPFRAHDRVKEHPGERVKLSDEEITKLEELELPSDGVKNWLFHARNFYLFSYYNAGIRISDLLQLRMGSIRNGRLEYEMNKTGHKKSIALNSRAQKILALYYDKKAPDDRYLFPGLDNSEKYAKYVTYAEKRKMPRLLQETLFNDTSALNTQVNQALTSISALAELDADISFHTSRHSFADKARRTMKKSGKVNIYDIKNALGHQSIVTTEKYIKSFDKESLDEAMGDIFD